MRHVHKLIHRIHCIYAISKLAGHLDNMATDSEPRSPESSSINKLPSYSKCATHWHYYYCYYYHYYYYYYYYYYY